MPIAFYICAAVTAFSAYVSLGFAVSSRRSARDSTRTGSTHAIARSAALVVVATMAPFIESVGINAVVGITMVMVQAADSVMGALMRERVNTYGPAFVALANLVVLVWMLSTR